MRTSEPRTLTSDRSSSRVEQNLNPRNSTNQNRGNSGRHSYWKLREKFERILYRIQVPTYIATRLKYRKIATSYFKDSGTSVHCYAVKLPENSYAFPSTYFYGRVIFTHFQEALRKSSFLDQFESFLHCSFTYLYVLHNYQDLHRGKFMSGIKGRSKAIPFELKSLGREHQEQRSTVGICFVWRPRCRYIPSVPNYSPKCVIIYVKKKVSGKIVHIQ